MSQGRPLSQNLDCVVKVLGRELHVLDIVYLVYLLLLVVIGAIVIEENHRRINHREKLPLLAEAACDDQLMLLPPPGFEIHGTPTFRFQGSGEAIAVLQ
ncbi:MAG TPA: hypothetical protein VIK04_17755 [Solirubrobacteraceae bacterium]